MRTTLRFFVLLLVFSGFAVMAARADGRLRVDLYLAENGPPAPGSHLAPEKLHEQLREVFGFRHYELLQSENFELRHEWEQWFMPRRDFFMRIEPLPRAPGMPRVVDYDIYQSGFRIANGRFEPQSGTPLFITGPDFHQGRLVLVLETSRKDDDEP